MTLEALASIPDGAGGLSVETVVVDNGSADGTAAAVAARFPGARLVVNSGNAGFARAANQGWRLARGETVLFLNSDARLAPGAAARLHRFLVETPRAGLAGAQLAHADGSLQNAVDNVPTLATELLNKSLLRRLFPRRYPGKRSFPDRPAPVPTLVGACFAARRACLEALGGFDERFFFFMEETDLCLRAWRAGWEVYLVPDARATHLQGRTAARDRVGARIEYFRSRYTFFRKHRGRLATGLLAGGLVLRLSAEAVLQGAACAATLFADAARRRRWATTLRLLVWHAVGCPRGAGLPRGRPGEAA